MGVGVVPSPHPPKKNFRQALAERLGVCHAPVMETNQTTEATNRLSDEALTADLGSSMPGIRNSAEILLGVPAHARRAIQQEALFVVGNHLGGRPSDNLANAAWHFGLGDPFTSPLAAAIAAEDGAA